MNCLRTSTKRAITSYQATRAKRPHTKRNGDCHGNVSPLDVCTEYSRETSGTHAVNWIIALDMYMENGRAACQTCLPSWREAKTEHKLVSL